MRNPLRTLEEVAANYDTPDEEESFENKRRRLARRRQAMRRYRAQHETYAQVNASLSVDNVEATSEFSDVQMRHGVAVNSTTRNKRHFRSIEEVENVYSGDANLESPEDRRRRLGRMRVAVHRYRENNTALPVQSPTTDQIIQAPQNLLNLIQMNVLNTTSVQSVSGMRCGLKTIDEFDPHILPHSLGPRNKLCPHCRAFLWLNEKNSICCVQGNVALPSIPEPPQQLKDLWANTTFRKMSRSYNSVFAFTSMGASLSENICVDQRYANGANGIYTFRIQGTICHRIGSLLPSDGHDPHFAQIYVYDGDMDHQVCRRTGIMNGLDENIVRTIQQTLIQIPNPFVEMFLSAGEFARTGVDFQLVIHETRKVRRDPRTHNTPVCNEVAAIILDEYASSNRDIVLHSRGGGFQRVSDMHSAFDPLHFPLLHPTGDPGWSADVSYPNGILRYGNTRVKLREYYSFRLMTRENQYSALHLASRLFQQWCVEQYVKLEVQRLRFIRCNQRLLQGDLFRGVYDALLRDDLTSIGTCIYLPASFTGGERYMRKQYYDSMSIVREFGKPDLFMTVTCNPAWDEIKDNLLDDQKPEDRPDLTTRVFKQKFDAIKKDFFEGGVFGKTVAHVYVIEFQKRGLPHAHVLIKLADEDRPHDTDDYDKFVCAEIPNPHEHKALYNVVTNSMIHGPCGLLNPRAPCMKDGKCSKRFPKEFKSRTTTDQSGYPLYRRRNNGYSTIRLGCELDNRWVVPYNPYLCQKYKCHINMEICSTISSVKYVYKYIYKGPDRAVVSITDNSRGATIINIDEIEQHQSARYISPPEACWRIFDFDLQAKSHSVIQLPVHSPELNWVVYNPTNANYETISRSRHTMLTRFFEICSGDPNAVDMLYHETPKRYTWNRQANEWRVRQRGGQKTIGRMISVSPKDVERYHLRLLLCFVKGPKSFEHLRTVDGRIFPTFQEAALARGLLENDQEWIRCMQEASELRMPASLRFLFVTIITSCNPSDPMQLWELNLPYMSEDIQREMQSDSSDPRVVYRTLLIIERILESNGFHLHDYPMLPQVGDFPDTMVRQTVSNPLSDIERSYDQSRMQQIVRGPPLNEAQQHIYDTVITATTDSYISNKLFFVDGPGGTGKSFVLERILASVRLSGYIALAVATSGIASLQLTGGRTAHSLFKLPLKLTSESTCSIPRQSHRAGLLRESRIIIWDEAPMMHKYGIEALDRTLRNLMGLDSPFGGKVVVLSGDFRQILPVVPRGTSADIINACIKRSPLWCLFIPLRLARNMRLLCHSSSIHTSREQFAKFLLQVGEGRNPPCLQCGLGYARIPKQLFIHQPDNVDNLSLLIDKIYPRIGENFSLDQFLSNRAILTPWNAEVHVINNRILDMLHTEYREYSSIDSVEEQEGIDNSTYQVEYLNSIEIPGLPSHKLRLKVGVPIMLLRNIDGAQGLCNGTRLQVVRLSTNCIVGKVLTGPKTGSNAFIPRIPLIASDFGLPFSLRRRQFPVILAFAMTINKAQGQTVPHLGIFLPRPAFAHGQLYVALSRANTPENISIVVQYQVHEGEDTFCIDNVVYPGIAN